MGLFKIGTSVIRADAFKINVCITFCLVLLFCAFVRVNLNEVCKFSLPSFTMVFHCVSLVINFDCLISLFPVVCELLQNCVQRPMIVKSSSDKGNQEPTASPDSKFNVC